MQVVEAPGAKVVAAQTAAASSCVSEIATPLNVTLPLLVTVNVYEIVEPAVAPVGASALLATVIAGTAGNGVEVLDGADTVGLLSRGAVPDAVAVLSTLPASTSVCVMV